MGIEPGRRFMEGLRHAGNQCKWKSKTTKLIYITFTRNSCNYYTVGNKCLFSTTSVYKKRTKLGIHLLQLPVSRICNNFAILYCLWSAFLISHPFIYSFLRLWHLLEHKSHHIFTDCLHIYSSRCQYSYDT